MRPLLCLGEPAADRHDDGRDLREILRQARQIVTLDWIFFEGGEPFLYHPLLLAGVREAARLRFRVGVVSNAYWATDPDDAVEWLRPFAGLVGDISISSDLYHGSEKISPRATNACVAAERLGIPAGIISIAQPDAADASLSFGQLPQGESAVMCRGRAAERLAPRVHGWPAARFTECPHEDLRDPDRVHVDPFGNVLVCGGIRAGNVLETPLPELAARYAPASHPVIGPLLAGGPAELARRHGIDCGGDYADACHLCDHVRRALRGRFPETLGPDQMYGVVEKS